jgi:hypothetical protein
MAQQTAVKKLIDYITERGFDLEYEMEMSFLDIEKEQIIDAYRFPNTLVDMSSEQYYNETYNQNK